MKAFIGALPFLVLWLFCGILGYGMSMANFEHEFPTPCFRRSEHVGFSSLIGSLGPFGLVAGIFASNLAEHGLMYQRDCPRGEKR
jgi:hypothetical protein